MTHVIPPFIPRRVVTCLFVYERQEKLMHPALLWHSFLFRPDVKFCRVKCCCIGSNHLSTSSTNRCLTARLKGIHVIGAARTCVNASYGTEAHTVYTPCVIINAGPASLLHTVNPKSK